MDPDENLRLIRACMFDQPTDCARLVDLVRSLDHWLTVGGFLPAAWTRTTSPKDAG
jgi:hypothetical protein